MIAKAMVLIGTLLMLVICRGASAQPELCLANGTPGGNSWVICVNPRTPLQGEDFNINFSGELCGGTVQHVVDVQLIGNVYTIYYDFIRGFCPGVPGTARHFTQQAGVAAGDYLVRLFQRRVEELPPPPFDPSQYTLVREVTFTVQGPPPPPTPVPTMGIGGIALLIFGLAGIALCWLCRCADIGNLKLRRPVVG